MFMCGLLTMFLSFALYCFIISQACAHPKSDSGWHEGKSSRQLFSQLWLDYRNVSTTYAANVASRYSAISGCSSSDLFNSTCCSVLRSACSELVEGLSRMLLGGKRPRNSSVPVALSGVALVLTGQKGEIETNGGIPSWPPTPKQDGFVIMFNDTTNVTTVSSESQQGVLYGVFRLLLMLRREIPFTAESPQVVTEEPNAPIRAWNLWDNLDGTVERGYAGLDAPQGAQPTSSKSSIVYPLDNADPLRMSTYARLLASVGINFIVWNNVNACIKANKMMLHSDTISAMAPLVNLFYRFHIFSAVTPCFSAPADVGKLPTSDPKDCNVNAWWTKKAREFAETWPKGSFRGFLFKGDTEGQPGPNMYGMTELEGANYFGRILRDFDAIAIWRAFSHPPSKDQDQALYQYQRFKEWSGNTLQNVVLQTKNGPFDFQVREPVHSIFSLPNVSFIVELQATQEYLGQAQHLVSLVPQWGIYFRFPLGSRNMTLANVTNSARFSGVAAVANVGSSGNWTGHIMSASNFYGFGRVAWQGGVVSPILREWTQATFAGSTPRALETVEGMLRQSWQAYENYTSSLGWGFSCAGNHYDMDLARRQDYINASKTHIGYHRGVPGGYGETYDGSVAQRLLSPETCPEELLLAFHNVPYNFTLKDRNNITVMEWIYDSHAQGAMTAQAFVDKWESLKEEVSLASYADTFDEITARLKFGSQSANDFAHAVRTFFDQLLTNSIVVSS